MFRIAYIIFLLIKHYLLYILSKKGLVKTRPEKILRSFFEEAQGTFIKFGQLLSLRVDALTKESVRELLNLFDQVKPFPYHQVERIFSNELGSLPQEVFSEFEKKPFASASFGQVHKAKLADGTLVAVKVLRPGIEKKVKTDFFLIGILAFFADLFFRIEALSWKEAAREFKQWTKQELDYRIEAQSILIFYKNNLAQQGNINVPRVYPEISTKRILVEDYLEGITLNSVLSGLRNGTLNENKLEEMGIDIKKVPRILTKEILREFFMDGLYHADPHPGNIILQKDGKIGLVDFGITGQTPIYNKASFVRTVKAWSEMDFKTATYHFANFVSEDLKNAVSSALPTNVSIDKVDQFMQVLANHFSEQVKRIVEGNRKYLEVMKKDYTIVFLELINAAGKYRIKLPREMVIFLRTLSIVGYLAKELDYEFKLTDETKNFFAQYPEEVILREWDVFSPYKRVNREKAVEQISSWLSYLIETDYDLYKVINRNIGWKSF